MHEATLENWNVSYADNGKVHVLINSRFLIVLDNSNVTQFLESVEASKGSITTTADVLVPQSYTVELDDNCYCATPCEQDEEVIIWNYQPSDSDLSAFVVESAAPFTLVVNPEDKSIFEHSLYSTRVLDYILY